jgi:hypothetical protein
VQCVTEITRASKKTTSNVGCLPTPAFTGVLVETLAVSLSVFSEVTTEKFTYLAVITENNEMSVGLLTEKHQQPSLNTPRLFIANESKLDSVQL